MDTVVPRKHQILYEERKKLNKNYVALEKPFQLHFDICLLVIFVKHYNGIHSRGL